MSGAILMFGAAAATALAGRPANVQASTQLLPTVSLPALPTLPTLPSPSLPLPTPNVSPPALPTALPTLIPTALPSPPVNLTPSPSQSPSPPTPTSAPGGLAGGGSGGSGSAGDGRTTGGGGGGGTGGIQIPLTNIVLRSPLDVALVGAVAVLPLLLVIWLFVFGRTWSAAVRSRDAQVRLALAFDLGLSPRELMSVTTRGLFKLREEAAFDELTGVLRRAAGVAALDREVARARRQKAVLSIAFLDLDGLKQSNDTRGHRAGDELLRGMANTLKAGLRGQDLVMRYGGDEFVCILPDTSAEATRVKIGWIQEEAARQGVGFSAGVAELERSDDVVSLLARADQEMYAVKSRRGKVRDIRLGVVRGRRETDSWREKETS